MSALPEAARDEYVVFCEAVQSLCKIDLLQYKRAQMERRIRTFAERRGVRRLSEYADVLRGSGGELDEFLDRITINVSQLWRNPEQWELLRRQVVPELAEQGRIRAWSAGCSYGAEAYTLAAICQEAAPAASLVVKGTDIDRRMVDRARSGWFSREDARDAPRGLLAKWFDVADGGHVAGAALKARTRFEVGDLLTMRCPAGAHDLVLCRNTVIYFTEDVRDALHARLAGSLRPGGYLVVGATERVANAASMGLVPAHPFTYRKV